MIDTIYYTITKDMFGVKVYTTSAYAIDTLKEMTAPTDHLLYEMMHEIVEAYGKKMNIGVLFEMD